MKWRKLNLIFLIIMMKLMRDRLWQIIIWKFYKFRKGNLINSLIYLIGFYMKIFILINDVVLEISDLFGGVNVYLFIFMVVSKKLYFYIFI